MRIAWSRPGTWAAGPVPARDLLPEIDTARVASGGAGARLALGNGPPRDRRVDAFLRALYEVERPKIVANLAAALRSHGQEEEAARADELEYETYASSVTGEAMAKIGGAARQAFETLAGPRAEYAALLRERTALDEEHVERAADALTAAVAASSFAAAPDRDGDAAAGVILSPLREVLEGAGMDDDAIQREVGSLAGYIRASWAARTNPREGGSRQALAPTPREADLTHEDAPRLDYDLFGAIVRFSALHRLTPAGR